MNEPRISKELINTGFIKERSINADNSPFGIREYLNQLRRRKEENEIEEYQILPCSFLPDPYYDVYIKLKPSSI